MVVYANNSVVIELQPHELDAEVIINGKNLMFISASEIENFKKELSELLDKFII